MSITIIECTKSSITLANFSKKNLELLVEYEAIRILKNRQRPAIDNDWINEASQAIHELVNEAKTTFPTIIILPGFALLTRIIQVPKVSPIRQKEIIQTHVNNLLGTGKEEYLSYDIAASEEFKLDAICALVKKDWIESFCNAIEPIGMQIISIEPPSIHYLNAYRKRFPNDHTPILLVIIQSSSACCCLFLNKHYISIYQINIQSISCAEEIKKLIGLHNKKHPEHSPKEIAVSGQYDNGDFVDTLKKAARLPTKVFKPLHADFSHLIGSIGAAYPILFSRGLCINLIPPRIKKNWAFNGSKKALLIAGTCIAASLVVLLNTINNEKRYYTERCQALESKILPLRKMATIIKHNEKSIAFYNEGLGALESYIASNKSWIHFFNSIQRSLIAVPHARIHSLKVIDAEYKTQNNWEDELMGIQKTEVPSWQPQLMQIMGSFQIEANRPANDAIDQINLLTSELTNLEFVEETKNLYFDIQSLPTVPFSFSLALKPNIF